MVFEEQEEEAQEEAENPDMRENDVKSSEEEMQNFIEKLKAAKIDEFSFGKFYNEFEGLRRIIGTTEVRSNEKLGELAQGFQQDLNIAKKKTAGQIPEPYNRMINTQGQIITLEDDVRELSVIRFNVAWMLLKRAVEIIEGVKGAKTSTEFLKTTMDMVEKIEKGHKENMEKLSRDALEGNQFIFTRLMNSSDNERARSIQIIQSITDRQINALEIMARQIGATNAEIEKMKRLSPPAQLEKFMCDFPGCGESFDSRDTLQSHMKQHAKVEEKKAEAEQKKKEDTQPW